MRFERKYDNLIKMFRNFLILDILKRHVLCCLGCFLQIRGGAQLICVDWVLWTNRFLRKMSLFDHLLFPGTSQNSPAAGWSGAWQVWRRVMSWREGGEVVDGRDRGGGKEVLDGRREEVGWGEGLTMASSRIIFTLFQFIFNWTWCFEGERGFGWDMIR